jgi:hypothetical protein
VPVQILFVSVALAYSKILTTEADKLGYTPPLVIYAG